MNGKKKIIITLSLGLLSNIFSEISFAKVLWAENWDGAKPFIYWTPECPECFNANTGLPGAIDLGAGQGINGSNAAHFTYTDINTGGGPFMDRSFILSFYS